MSRAALGFVALAAVMGWGASFVGLHAYGQDQMVGFSYWTAWLIPATFDGAAFGATLITYRASIYGRSAVRGRLLMWTFTAISSWINWIHQTTPEARIVAAGLPVAAVAVFDVVLAELRADYEERHGKRRLRLRPGLLLLRWLVDRGGTAGAFRRQVTDIPVSEIAGLGPTLHDQIDASTAATNGHPTYEIPIVQQPRPAPQAVRVAEPVSPLPQPEPEPRQSPATSRPEPEVQQPQQTAETRPEGQAETKAEPEPETKPEGGSGDEPATQSDLEDDDRADLDDAIEAENADENEAAKSDSTVKSAEQTQTLPPVPADPLTDENKRTFARRDYRLSLEIGEPITGAQLGQRYGFSERWGRRQIAAVRVEMEHDEQKQDRQLIGVD